MALESATYIDELVSTNPLASDNVSQGDNHLRLIKSVLQSSFPSVDMAVNAIHASDSAPAESITAGLVWFDTSANLLKIRNEAGEYLGEAGGDIWDSEHLVEANKKYDEQGTYSYRITHVMPQDPLNFGMDIGVILDKVAVAK